MIAATAIGIGCFVGFQLADAGLGAATIKPQRPNFKFVKGTTGTDLVYVVFDGFIGHPEKRFEKAMDAFDDHSVLFVNPAGDRFNLEFEVHQTIAKLEQLGIRKVILVGGSLGAKKAYRTAQLLPSFIELDSIKLIDPLYDGSGVKNPLATLIKWTAWHPGPIQNWLLSRGHFVGRATTNMWPWNGRKPMNAHQKYGFNDVKASRVADEARESKRGPIEGVLPQQNLVHVTLIYCSDDEVLKDGQWQKWRDRLRKQGHMVEPISVGDDTLHMSIDTKPASWLPHLRHGLTPMG